MFFIPRQVAGVSCFVFLLVSESAAAPWIAADWGGKEPEFPPGSLYWHTNRYEPCPVLFRTVIQVENESLAFAGFQAQASDYAIVFLNGDQIRTAKTEPFAVELTELLKAGPNVLIISTKESGFSLEGGVGYEDGRFEPLRAAARRWKVQKFAPLTLPELEPCSHADFDDSRWFPVKETSSDGVTAEKEELQEICQDLAGKRLENLDEHARWRLNLLVQKGIAVVNWEACDWAGAGRLPDWLLELSGPEGRSSEAMPGSEHLRAEALCRYVVLHDETTNLANLAVALEELEAPKADINALRSAARRMESTLEDMEEALKKKSYEEALTHAEKLQVASNAARKGRLLNRLNRCLDNKFSWFDTTELLDSDPDNWGLNLGSPAKVFKSPLSPAALVTTGNETFVLEGWDKHDPLRVYDRKNPPTAGPVAIWAVVEGKTMLLRPEGGGTVYDRAVHGKLTENWVLLVNDMSRGGNLPIQLVLLETPKRIAFEADAKEGTRAVAVTFEKSGARLFLLRPLKEWRGFLRMAQSLTQYGRMNEDKSHAPTHAELDEKSTAVYLRTIRLWSRALLDYPVNFSEAFIKDPANPFALLVTDVYDYRTFQDAWNTEPLRLAPLPPLATYGLMTGYPGLEVLGEGKVLGSRGIWGDLVAAVGQSHIIYRVPLHRIKRFGGFTSYCFGGTDIGGPGSKKEIETISVTGSNSFRPQHNQTGERAMRTAGWCREQGIQNVFNTDEKWVPDIVEHYRTLSRKCRDFPPDAIAYDLLNEPETREPRAYGALIRKITSAIREIDKTHLIYVETIPPWGPGAKPFPKGAFETLEPTGDALTVYSFHDYDFRLGRIQHLGVAGRSEGSARWPNENVDVRDLLSRWIPAFRYSIDHRVPIHLGEFGGFEQVRGQNIYENACVLTLLMDHFNIFDQFGWHWNYYANRGTIRVRCDGSLEQSYVHKAFRRYFDRGTFNANWPR